MPPRLSIRRFLAVLAVALWLWVAGALVIVNTCGHQCGWRSYVHGWPMQYCARISNHSVPTLLELRYGGLRFEKWLSWRSLLIDLATAGLILAATASVLRSWPRANLRHMQISLANMFSLTTASAALLGLTMIEIHYGDVLTYHDLGGYWPLRGSPIWLQIPLYFGVACMACYVVSVILRFFSSFVLPKDCAHAGEKTGATSEVQEERPSAKRRRWGKRTAALLAILAVVLAVLRCVFDFGYAHPLTESDTLRDYVGKNVTFRGIYGSKDGKPLPPILSSEPDEPPRIVRFQKEVMLVDFHPAVGPNVSDSPWPSGTPKACQPIMVTGTLGKCLPGTSLFVCRLGYERLPVNYCLRDAFWHDASEEAGSGDRRR